MSFKTPILCDRRVYDKKGKWKSPNNDYAENIYYFVSSPLTLVAEYRNGIEEMVESMSITVFGGKPIVKEDSVWLDNGTQYRVVGITINYVESNILIKDMLKPRIESMVLTLE